MILKNEVKQVGLTISNNSEFALDPTGVGLGTNAPDGSLENYTSITSPAVTVNPGTISLTQDLDITLSFDQAGLWRLEWTAAIGPEIKFFQENYFVAYTDLSGAIRQTLSKSKINLTDELLDLYISRVTRILELDYPLLPSYAALTGNDKYLMDEALTLFVSAYLDPDLVSTKPKTRLIGVTIGTDELRYSDKSAVGPAYGNDDWIGQALQIFSQISTLKPQFSILSNSPLFVAAGARKNARTKIGLVDSVTPRYDLYSDARMAWDWNKIYASYFR